VNIFYKELEEKGIEPDEYPILDELYKVFNQSYDISSFVINLLKNQSI